jgi:hypothetical protein
VSDIVERLLTRVNGIVFPDKLAEEAASEIERLRRQVEASRRYFEHCQRVSLSARHAGCESGEMDVRMSLKREAEEAVGIT